MSKDNRPNKNDLERKKAEDPGADPNGEKLEQATEEFKKALLDASHEKTRKALKSIVEDMGKDLAEALAKIVRENMGLFEEQLKKWEALQPYIAEELKKPEYGGLTLEDLLANEYQDKDGDPTEESLLEKAIEAAERAQKESALPIVTVKNKGVDKIDFPLDKINANIWGLLQVADKDGQLTFAVEKRGSKKTADIIYSINFDELEKETGVTITKKLNAFDKRCYISMSALFNSGFDVCTISQIYAGMGYKGRPGKDDIDKINDSITKMNAAHVYLSNESEFKLYPQKGKFVYDASLLPMERVSAIINGQAAEGAIHLFREPPLVSFARERKQITTVSRQLLESPISKTDANLQLDDYLIERISHIKNSKGKISNKLLFTTIYEKVGIKTKMQRNRAASKIEKYLKHYKKCEFIKNYSIDADGITIKY